MTFPRKPTSSLFLSSSSSSTSVSTTSSSSGSDTKPKVIIDEEWIDSLVKKIDSSYPKTQYSWQKPEYPQKDLDYAYVNNKNKNDTYKRYNPFNLRLPYILESYEHLYDYTKILREKYSFEDKFSIKEMDAKITYFDLLKQYNLAYIIFLRTINGSKEAASQLIELFTTEKIFSNANIKMTVLKPKKPTDFLLGLLAYLTLDIVFSKENNISTTARIKALDFVRLNFDIEKTAQAFDGFSHGYCLPYDVKSEPVYDMIPRRFVTESYESGGTPHNNIFLENAKIKEIFKICSRTSMSLDYGVSTLLNKYPSEMAQTLESLLRCNINIKYIFTALVSLSKLDESQKNLIFGNQASFRSNGESKCTLETRIGWAIGNENFGDYLPDEELDKLTKEELKTRIRQSAFRIHQLESELVEKEKESVLNKVNTSNDPKGYFATLLIHPNTPEESFEELLKRHYRVLALKYHPDRPNGNEEKFKELLTAYEFLLKKENRKSYCDNNQSNTFGI